MLDRLIRRHRSARRAFALAVILAFALLVAVAMLTVGWFSGILRVMGFFSFAQLLVQAALLPRWGRGANSKKSPLRGAALYGEPGEVLAAIDAEVAAGRDVLIFGHTVVWYTGFTPDLVLLTPSWLVQANRAGLTHVRLDDILWLFRFRRLGPNLCGVAIRSQGFRVCVSSEEVKEFPIADAAEADAILDEILRRRPELFAGFDESSCELLGRGAGPMAAEVDRRRRECSALETAGRERWQAEQRRLLDETAQFLSTRGRDKVRAALETAAWSRKGQPGEPPDRNAGLILDHILATEWLRFAGALTVAVVATVPLMLLTIGALSNASANTWAVVVLITSTLLAAGWTTIALRYVIWSPARRLGPFLNRHGLGAIDDVNADLLIPATRWVYGNWPRSVLYPPPDFVALGATRLVQMRLGHAVLVYLPELVWVHERVVPNLLWGVSDRYRFELAGRLRDGATVSVRLDDEAELGELLEELLERHPAMLTGWRGEWLGLLEAGPAAVAAAHDARDREFAALPPEKREAWLDESWDLFQRFVENAP